MARKDSGLSFWFNKWMDKDTFRSLMYGPLNRGEEEVRLKDVTSFFGWNWEGLSFIFPSFILLSMKATPIPFSNQSEDRISRCLSPSGESNTKDAYCIANTIENQLTPRSFSGDWVWKIPSLPKVKFFLWQCCHQSILVRMLLAERGMDISPQCPMCNSAPKSVIHALKDCPKAQLFWNSFSPPASSATFYGTQLLDWLRINCKSSQHCGTSKIAWAIILPIAEIAWAIIFPIAIWSLWLNRNNAVFKKTNNQKDLRAETLARATEVAFLGIAERHSQAK